VLFVAGPEGGFVQNGGGGDKGIRNLQAMALAELAKKAPSQLTEGIFNRDAYEQAEKTSGGLLLV
jgi:hypothetical protein